MSLTAFVPSGAIPKKGLAKFFALSLVLALVGGLFFGAFCRFNPLVYIPIGIMGMHVSTLGVLAAWVGTIFFLIWGFSKGVRSAKIQNPMMIGLTGLCLGLIAYYVHWCALSSLTVMEWVFLPQDVLSFMQALIENEYASFGLIDWPESNWFFWGIEALGFAALGILGPSDAAAAPFCAACDTWADTPAGRIDLPFTLGEDEAKEMLESENFARLNAVVGEGGQPYRLSLCACETCKTNSFLSVHRLEYEVDDEGEVTEKQHAVSQNLVMSPAQVSALENALKESINFEGEGSLFGIATTP